MSLDEISASRIDFIRMRQEELLLNLIEEIEFLEKETDVKLDFSSTQLESLLKNTTVYSTKNYIKLREKLSDKEYIDTVTPLIEKIPNSNGSRYFKKFDINIGITADEF